MIKLMFKAAGMLVSVLAGAIFKKIWKITAREDQAACGCGWRGRPGARRIARHNESYPIMRVDLCATAGQRGWYWCCPRLARRAS
jgi:hypothetical protein